MKISRVGVAGAGTMGRGIAQVLLRHGYSAVLQDSEATALESARQNISAGLGREVSKGSWPEGEKRQAESRLITTRELSDLASADLVIEAVTESYEVKAGVFRHLDSICGPETIFASNTSSISITRLARNTGRPQLFVGMHFFNPVPAMKLVEVVRGLETAEKTAEAVERLAASLGKTPIGVKDSPGFVSNRLLMPMINEAVYAVMEGVSDPQGVDGVMKLGMNHPLGPLELADLIGLDVCLDIMRVLYQDFSDSKYRPCPLLERMVSAGRLGRKTGRGFYQYPKQGS
jgi:3-hydroxybutyryl-CoA dehydrogenase